MALSPTSAAQSLSSIALTSPTAAKSSLHSQPSSSMLSLSPPRAAAAAAAVAAGEEFTDVHINWQLVVVTVPPGPLGILLDSAVQSAAVLEGFAPVNAEGSRGAVELHGGVLPGSVLVSVNQYDLTEENMSFGEIGQVLRETSHLERELTFQVPVPVPVAQSATPSKLVVGEAEWSDAELAQELSAVSPASVELPDFHMQLQPDSLSTDKLEGAYDQLTDHADDSLVMPPKIAVSRTSSASSKKSTSSATTNTTTKKGWKIGGYTMPALPNMPNMPSMPSMKFSKISITPPTSIAGASTLLFGPSTPKATEEPKFVTVEAPAGPLGLNLDGGILDRAVVVGFVPLPDDSVGALEAHGGVQKGSELIKINDHDVSKSTLDEIHDILGELSGVARTLVFRLPSHAQGAGATKAPAPRAVPVPLVEDLDKRRKLELALVVKYDKAKITRKECWFVIDAHWMNSWVEFAARGGPPPGPITNEMLLEPEWHDRLESKVPGRPDAPQKGLVLMKDYRCVTPMVWCLFVELHGMSEAPILPRFKLDIDAEAVGETEMKLILQEPSLKAAILANELRDKCVKHA